MCKSSVAMLGEISSEFDNSFFFSLRFLKNFIYFNPVKERRLSYDTSSVKAAKEVKKERGVTDPTQ